MEPVSDAVYYTLWGALLEGYRVEGVPNLFAPGSPCEVKYTEMLDAYQRLIERLGAYDEDEDVEKIINSMMTICHEVGIHMFEWGKRMA